MNLKSILVILLLLGGQLVFSQRNEREIKFGDIEPWEWEMQAYSGDSTAAAVVLFDRGENILEFNNFRYKRHVRIKVFKPTGYFIADSYVPIYKYGYQKLTRFRATTYNNVDGKVVETKLTSEGFFAEDFNDYFDVMRFSMPAVKEGSIFEFSYEIDGVGLRGWDFQSTVPIMWSEYNVRIINRITYHKLYSGHLAPFIFLEEDGNCVGEPCKKIRIVLKDVPAFKPEPHISSAENYKSKISFEIAAIKFRYNYPPQGILGTWDALAFRYHEDEFFGDNVKNSGPLREIAENLVKGKTFPEEKMMAIYDYVKDHMEWNKRHSVYCYEGLKKPHESGVGSSADINLMLLSMLRYAGLPADPVLISTRDNGMVRQEVPIGTQFNNVLVLTQLGGKEILLDATDKHLGFDFIPEDCLNGVGYLAVRENWRWIDLKSFAKTKVVYKGEFTIDESGLLKGKLATTKNGYEAQKTKTGVAHHGDEKYWNDQFMETRIKFDHSTLRTKGAHHETLEEDHEITLDAFAESGGDVIYFSPVVFNQLKENPFKQEERRYPVDFAYPREMIYMATFDIPEGFLVEEIPQPRLAILPDNTGRFSYSATLNNGKLTVMNQFVMNRTLFDVDEYPDVREFFKVIAAKQAEQIVLVKDNK